jgi:hypothetical protein
MHQYKTITQTLFLLSILNLVFAAPLVPREVHDTPNDVVAEDGSGGSERRRELQPAGSSETPPQYPSDPQPDGLQHTPQSSAIEKATLLDPTMETSTSAQPSSESAVDRPAPVPDSNTGASTSSHSSLATDRPASVSDSRAGGSTTTSYTTVSHDMVDKKPKFYQKPLVRGVAVIATLVAAYVAFVELSGKHKDD